MLRSFEQSLSGFIPEEQPTGELEKLKEIDSYNFNSFESKVWDIWQDNSIEKSKKYNEIFKLFFSAFCNKLGKQTKIEAATGQWIQGTLERFGCMDIPIAALLNETSTNIISPDKQKERELFNRELSSRSRGAISTVSYINNREKEKGDQIRIIVDDDLDLKYKADMIEIIGFTTDSIEELYVTQVKTDSKMASETKEEIHKKHIELLKKIQIEEKLYTQNIEKEKQEIEEYAIRINTAINEIEEFVSNLQNISQPKTIVKRIVTQFNLEEDLFLKTLAISNFTEDDILDPEKLKPIFDLAQEYSKKISEERLNSVTLSKAKKIISKITNGNQVISEIVLRG